MNAWANGGARDAEQPGVNEVWRRQSVITKRSMCWFKVNYFGVEIVFEAITDGRTQTHTYTQTDRHAHMNNTTLFY